jgi:hypothetical protein
MIFFKKNKIQEEAGGQVLLGARHSLIVYVYYYTSHLKHRPKLTTSMLARYIASEESSKTHRGE